MNIINNNIGNISSISDSNGGLHIKSDSSFFKESFYFIDMVDESAVKKFVKSTERLIRTSREYNDYIKVIRETHDELNVDSLMVNVTSDDASLEFHHYPFTLYELVHNEMKKKFLNKEPFTSFNIARDIMKLHYENLIGIVPLTTTMHELAHDGSIFISESQIFGNFKEYISLYEPYIDVETKNKLSILKYNSEAGLPTDIKGYVKYD